MHTEAPCTNGIDSECWLCRYPGAASRNPSPPNLPWGFSQVAVAAKVGGGIGYGGCCGVSVCDADAADADV